MSKQKVMWECTSCGHTQSKWSGSCLSCNDWNSFTQQIKAEVNKRFEGKNQTAKPVRLKDVNLTKFHRLRSKMNEFDRLLGGGAAQGSLSLIGGDPGVGKSTLLLQIASSYAREGHRVLYVCGEESEQQTSLRASRLQIEDHENLFLLSETLFNAIKVQIDQIKPDVLIVDSIQILYKSEIPSSPGSIVQVRELATEFMHIAKTEGITTFLIGHVTKSGEIAGPKVLEHLVDVVLDFEGDKKGGFRLLRSIKNRFGPTDDIALFQMQEDGLNEVINPSKAFLTDRVPGITGSVIIPTTEGARSILIEVQSLVTPSVFSTPSRKSTGLNANRLALLLAVLEKRVGYLLHQYDVFVSVAGGMKILEPAIDLGILLSIASSFSNQVIDEKTIVIGEVGLGGEVRRVTKIESRIKEAINMGFEKIVFPKQNLQELSNNFSNKISLIGVNLVEEAIAALIQ